MLKENEILYWQFERFEFSVYKHQIDTIPNQGNCFSQIEALVNEPNIKSQFDNIDPQKIADELRDYGAWDDSELENHKENQYRITWIAIESIKEELRNE